MISKRLWLPSRSFAAIVGPCREMRRRNVPDIQNIPSSGFALTASESTCPNKPDPHKTLARASIAMPRGLRASDSLSPPVACCGRRSVSRRDLWGSGSNMTFELDHLLICASPGGGEAGRLAEFGLTEGAPNTHPGRMWTGRLASRGFGMVGGQQERKFHAGDDGFVGDGWVVRGERSVWGG